VKVSVVDTGTGIAPEIRARILEPFFTTKPFGSGSGLGLSMVFGFARQSGGDLTISSEVGRGTSVSLILPRAQGAAPVEVASEYVPVTGAQGELVLLVEDHDDVRQAIRRHLLELGHQVLEARDGEDALALLSAVPDVKLLLSDVIMPGIDGLTLADRARRLVPGIKILLISGFANVAAAADCEWFDERSVLRKPFGKDELARALARARP
jgi:CheY-like chemotaxis protein